MEYAAVRALLDKYWEAETTLEEESALAAYFRQPDIDPRLQPFREMFVYFEQESRVTPGEGFEKRILDAVRGTDHDAPVRRLWRGMNKSYAAAAVVILVIGLFIMVPSSKVVEGGLDRGGATATRAQMEDTYKDPQQALAAIRHALFTASARMNQGKVIAQKNMDRVVPALQTVKRII